MSMKDVFVVIPAYNEGKVISSVLQKIKKAGFSNIIVVDDCSKDNTALLAKKQQARVVKHSLNRGAGAATKTGIDAAKELGAHYVVTIDADGQHDPAEIERLLKKAPKYDVVIGSRMINSKGMPISRKILNWGGSIITFLFYGIHVRDSQSGFKVFNRKAIENIEIKFDRFEFCSEVLHEIQKKKLTYTEVPISVIYTEYSLSKGQHISNGFRMIFRMIQRFFVP